MPLHILEVAMTVKNFKPAIQNNWVFHGNLTVIIVT